MIISKKRIRQIDLYLGALIPHSKFILSTRLDAISAETRKRVGIQGLNDGETILPAAIGPISKFNCEGKYIVLKNLPKETRFIGRREWTREQWVGRGQTETVTESTDIYRDCYPRSFIAPPSIEITKTKINSEELIYTGPYTWKQDNSDEILHAINLFLEFFGEVEIRHENFSSFLPPHTSRVNWNMLPSGSLTASGVIASVTSIVSRHPTTYRGPILNRLTQLAELKPQEVYVGQGGFTGYVAYVFNNGQKTVLESIMPDNATYIFDKNWKSIVQLTKMQVISQNLHLDRFIHDKKWFQNLMRHMK